MNSAICFHLFMVYKATSVVSSSYTARGMPWLANVNKWAGFTVFLMLNRHTCSSLPEAKWDLWPRAEFQTDAGAERRKASLTRCPGVSVKAACCSPGCCLSRGKKGPQKVRLFLSEWLPMHSRTWPWPGHSCSCPMGLPGFLRP